MPSGYCFCTSSNVLRSMIMSETSEDKNNSFSGSSNKYNNNKGKDLNFSWSWGVIGIVAFFLIFFIADGARWEVIKSC